MGRIADQIRLPGGHAVCGGGFFPQARAHFHPQDARYGIVDARQRNASAPHLAHGIAVEIFPVRRSGNHKQIHSGVDGVGAVVDAATGNMAYALPIADHNTIETEVIFQQVSEQAFVGVGVGTVPPAVARHNGLHAGLYGGDVTR